MGRVLGVLVVLCVVAVHLMQSSEASQGTCSSGGKSGSCIDDASGKDERHARLTGHKKREHAGNAGKTMKIREHKPKGKSQVRESKKQKGSKKGKRKGKGKSDNKAKKSKSKKTNKRKRKDKREKLMSKENKQSDKRYSKKGNGQAGKAGEYKKKKNEKAKASKNGDPKQDKNAIKQENENNAVTPEEILTSEAEVKENETATADEGVTDVNESASLTMPEHLQPNEGMEGDTTVDGEGDTATISGEEDEGIESAKNGHKIYSADLLSVSLEFDSAELLEEMEGVDGINPDEEKKSNGNAEPELMVNGNGGGEQEVGQESAPGDASEPSGDESGLGDESDTSEKLGMENEKEIESAVVVGGENGENTVNIPEKETGEGQEMDEEGQGTTDGHQEEEKMGTVIKDVKENEGQMGDGGKLEAKFMFDVVTEHDSSEMEEEVTQAS